MKPIILFDCDGVLADFFGGLIEYLYFRGIEIDRSSITHYRLDRCGFSHTVSSYIEELAERDDFCSRLRWMEGAKSALKFAGAWGDPFVVTAPWKHPNWAHDRREWLADYIDRDRVISCSGKHKHLVRGDVMIEDCAETLIEWCEENSESIGFLIKAPWNANTPPREDLRIYRVDNVWDAVTMARDMLEKEERL